MPAGPLRQRNLSRFLRTSEKGEPNFSEHAQHASLISWQRRSSAVCQLKATLASSQSSRKSATRSLDQSCPMTSMALHSLLFPYSSSSPEVTLAEHGLFQIGLCPRCCLSFRNFQQLYASDDIGHGLLSFCSGRPPLWT